MSKTDHSPPPISPEELSFYRAIWEAPQDDAPRLIYADWLEENPVTCSRCHGSGEVGVTFLYSNPKKPTEPTNRLPSGCTTCSGYGVSDRRQNQASLIRQDVELRRCKDYRKRHAVIMGMFRDRLKMTKLISMPIPMITTDLGSMGKTVTNLGLWEDTSQFYPEYHEWFEKWIDAKLEGILAAHRLGISIPNSWLRNNLHLKDPEDTDAVLPTPATPDLD